LRTPVESRDIVEPRTPFEARKLATPRKKVTPTRVTTDRADSARTPLRGAIETREPIKRIDRIDRSFDGDDRIKPPLPDPPPPPPPDIGKGRKKSEDKDEDKKKKGKVKGAIAWRQGAVGRPPQDVWYVIQDPYARMADVTIYIGVLPDGVKDVKPGKGSALRSIQTITGKPPAKLDIDLGIQDITITNPIGVGKQGAIVYSQDSNEQTWGDITIRKGVKTINKKKEKKKDYIYAKGIW